MPPVVGILFGVILLLVLNLAIVYASGWSPAPARPSGDDGADLGPERKTQIAIAITLAVGLLTLIYAFNEPNRQAEAYDRQKETSIDRRAAPVRPVLLRLPWLQRPGRHRPREGVLAANLTLRKATDDADDNKKLFDFLTKTITRGRPNTPMPAWGLSDGGLPRARRDQRAGRLHHARRLQPRRVFRRGRRAHAGCARCGRPAPPRAASLTPRAAAPATPSRRSKQHAAPSART